MLTLVNSVTYGAGASTLVYFLAKTRGALLGKPALIISTSDSKPYRQMMQIDKEWESPNLKAVLTKMMTYSDVKTFCYKAETYLYYLNIEGADIRTSEGRKGLNSLLRELTENKVKEGFESVWVDIDNFSGGFLGFVEFADIILVPMRANVLAVKSVCEKILNIRQAYVREFGIQMKHPVFFCVQKYCHEMPMSEIKKILQTQDRFVMPLGYDVEVPRSFNKGTLSFYLNELLAEAKTTEQKTIHGHLKTLLKSLKQKRR